VRPVAFAFVVFGSFAGAWGGAITDRFGARRVLASMLAVWGAFIAIQGASPRLAVFAPAFIVGLSAGGVVDVVMNVVAADALSHEPGRLVRFHGLFNFGAMAGAAVTGVVLRIDGSWRIVWFAVAVIAAVLAVTVTRDRRMPEPPRVEHVSMVRALIGLRHEGLLVLALVFGAAAMVEGGIATWGILFLRDHLGVGVLAGVTAYVVGQALATLARFGGRGLVDALGTRVAIALGAALAAAGIAAVALSGDAVIASAGLALAAVGISVVWPLLIADVNNEARHPALAIGGVTACGYLGMVIGPPIVGVLSGAFGLRTGLVVLAGIAVFVAVTPSHVRVEPAIEPATDLPPA
jgi:MFS family permease